MELGKSRLYMSNCFSPSRFSDYSVAGSDYPDATIGAINFNSIPKPSSSYISLPCFLWSSISIFKIFFFYIIIKNKKKKNVVCVVVVIFVWSCISCCYDYGCFFTTTFQICRSSYYSQVHDPSYFNLYIWSKGWVFSLVVEDTYITWWVYVVLTIIIIRYDHDPRRPCSIGFQKRNPSPPRRTASASAYPLFLNQLKKHSRRPKTYKEVYFAKIRNCN